MVVEERLHPITFYSRNFSAIKINYKIYDKKLFANIDLIKKCHHFLEGASHHVNVHTNQKNLSSISYELMY